MVNSLGEREYHGSFVSASSARGVKTGLPIAGNGSALWLGALGASERWNGFIGTTSSVARAPPEDIARAWRDGEWADCANSNCSLLKLQTTRRRG
jgi:hypothetical protein